MNNLAKEFYFELIIQTDNIELIKYALEDFDDLGIEEQNNILKIYCENDLEQIDFLLKTFCSKMKIKYSSNILKKKNQDWIQKYQQNINPIQINDFYIHTSWQKPKQDLINIEIDPSFAFGTGHHFTTSSMIENIIKHTKQNDKVLDIGTGSGILSIVSNKLGAIVDCCDVDSNSIQNTKENFIKNNATYNSIWTGSIDDKDKTYDIVLINIIADIIIAISKNIKKKLKTNSLLIMSGILTKYEDVVLESFKDFAIISISKSKDEQWLTIVLKKL